MTTLADLVARVKGVETRSQRNEEDITAIITTLSDTRRRVARVELGMQRLLAHMGLAMPSAEEVDATLDED